MQFGNEFEIDVCFIRHGMTPSNKEKKYISFTDEALSEEGKQLIKKLASNNNYYPDAEMVFTSSLKRTHETAKLIYPKTNRIEIKELDEINFGEFELKTYEELKAVPEYVCWLESGCRSKIPGGESMDIFVSRQMEGLKRILFMAKEKTAISIVTHGGTVMSIFSTLLDCEYYKYMLENGGYIVAHIKYRILENNDVEISFFSPTARNST